MSAAIMDGGTVLLMLGILALGMFAAYCRRRADEVLEDFDRDRAARESGPRRIVKTTSGRAPLSRARAYDDLESVS